MADYLSYFLVSFVTLLRLPHQDVVVAMSDPPFILLAAVAAGRLRGSAVCYWVQDVYPALAARLGVLREDGLAFGVFQAFARRLENACDLIVALGPEMVKALVRGGAPAERTVSIHNWADEEAIQPMAVEDNWFISANGLEGKMVVLYSGNAGRGHTFEALCEVMARFNTEKRVVFVFIGGGKKSSELRSFAEAKRLTNAVFLDYLPREQIGYSLSAATASVVTEDPAVAGLLVPSKTYGILASGRPVIFIGASHSDVAEIVRKAGCGVVIDPSDPDALESAIRQFMDDPTLCARMGAAAREAARTEYSRGISAARWATALSAISARSIR